MDLVKKAKKFAVKAHAGQFRKYTKEPYVNHPIAVAKIVSTVTHNKAMLAAAYLHDVVEDCGITPEEIEKEFGAEVGKMVAGLTDVSKPEDGDRKERKALDRIHNSQQSPKTQTIKLADLIHNTESIVLHDANFAKVYMREKQLLLEVLIKGDKDLWRIASAIVKDYYRLN